MSGKPELAIRLRQATQAAHRRLDQHPLLASLLAANIDQRGYGNALAALHGVFSAAEQLLARQETSDFPLHPRTPALEADLADLGRLPPAFTGTLPTAEIAGARIGLLYVLEGSALGGQMLARHLRAALGPACPLRFFAGQGATQAASRWAAFWAHAGKHCDPTAFPAAEAAATAMFSVFSQHLDTCLPKQQ